MISLNYRDARPIYEQIYDELRRLVISGAVGQDERLPSVRELAAKLAINPNTIQRAYRELENEGYICTVPGKGSFVSFSKDAALRRVDELINKMAEILVELKGLGSTRELLIKQIDKVFEEDGK